MATTMDEYFPFDAGAGGNAMEASWRKMAAWWLQDGVLYDGLSMTVVESTVPAMSVTVRTGKVWIQGHYGETTADKTLPIAPAHATLARKDLVIARADFANNRIELDVLTGTAAASPTDPALTQNTSIWEIALARVDVPATDTAITTSQITRIGRTIQPRPGYLGCKIRRVAAQSIGASSTAIITFDTEDWDSASGFWAPSPSPATVTIPPGFGGLYAITARTIAFGYAVGTTILAGGRKYEAGPLASAEAAGFGIVVELNPGDTIQVSAQNGNTSSTNFTASLDVFRLAPA